MSMTPEAHYREAERLLQATTPSEVARRGPLGDVSEWIARQLARAQVHATLALYRDPKADSPHEAES